MNNKQFNDNLSKLEAWAITKRLEVCTGYGVDAYYHDERHVVYDKKLRQKKHQIYSLLHECGHALAFQPPAAQWNGQVGTIIYHPTAPSTALSEAWMDGDLVSGESWTMDLVFTLDTAVSPETPVQVLLPGVVATDADANDLDTTLRAGVLVTSP